MTEGVYLTALAMNLPQPALRYGYISARGRDAKVHPEKEILK